MLTVNNPLVAPFSMAQTIEDIELEILNFSNEIGCKRRSFSYPRKVVVRFQNDALVNILDMNNNLSSSPRTIIPSQFRSVLKKCDIRIKKQNMIMLEKIACEDGVFFCAAQYSSILKMLPHTRKVLSRAHKLPRKRISSVVRKANAKPSEGQTSKDEDLNAVLKRKRRQKKSRDKWSLIWFHSTQVLNMREEIASTGQVIKKGKRIGFNTYNALVCEHCKTVFHKKFSLKLHMQYKHKSCHTPTC